MPNLNIHDSIFIVRNKLLIYTMCERTLVLFLNVTIYPVADKDMHGNLCNNWLENGIYKVCL
jgi:hypothetical protein